jgi:hypothetical protein
MKVTAGSWLIGSLCTDFTKHQSSAVFAMCGTSSENQAPDWPCWANANGDP